MFAVFEKTIANPEPRLAPVRIFKKMLAPEEAVPTAMAVTTMKEHLNRFESMYPSSIVVQKLPSCILSSKLDEQSITIQSYLVVKDDMICVFNGELKNSSVKTLRTLSGLHGEENKAALVISAYRKCGKEENGDWCNILKDLEGEFSLVTFDARDQTFFASTGPLRTRVQCYWGKDREGNMVFSTSFELARASCDEFYGSILGGCYVTTGKGLRSFENPLVQIPVEPIHSEASPENPATKRTKV